jgi:mannitol/fructose-specific phosphotransferase system IIA component (Ntr-type)/voltage-gated potassium channel Kch
MNPVLFRSLPRVEGWLRGRPRLWKVLNGRAERGAAGRNRTAAEAVAGGVAEGEGFALVVGYGPVGRSVDRVLLEAGLKTVVIDLNMDTVSALNAEGRLAIFGDASNAQILEQAGIGRATHLVLTLPQSDDRAAIVTAARSLNATVRILVRARYLREREELERSGATVAVFEEAEAAVALARLVLADTWVHRQAADRKIRDLERVVGRPADEPAHEPPVSLARAVDAGAVVPAVAARVSDEAIRELVAAVPAGRLPAGVDRAAVAEAVLAREAEVSTDLGNGVAIPHALIPGLAGPVVVLGRSVEGVVFRGGSGEPVGILFLLVTPAEQPGMHLRLLAQVARLVSVEANRLALRRAATGIEVMEILWRQEPSK